MRELLHYNVTFNQPEWLILLALVPLAWWLGRRSLRAGGLMPGLAALAIRSLVLIGLVLAIAEVQISRVSSRVNVFYLVDRSLSISPEELDRAIDFVNASMESRDRKRGDRVGVIAFGRDPSLLASLVEDPPQLPKRTEADVDPEHTNLADALKLAQASFPPDGAKRVVILSDGNQNYGDALAQARGLAEAAIGIDVVPLGHPDGPDVSLEKIAVSGEPRQGAPFEVRVVLDNAGHDAADRPQAVSGHLTVERRAGESTQIVSDERVTLEPGKRVFALREQLDTPDFYTYEARFVADDPSDDVQTRNNRATGFAHVRGQGRVLIVEDGAHRGQFDFLADRLRTEGLHVSVEPGSQLFGNLAELQRYDTVLLANVPRAGLNEVENVNQVSDEQIEVLVRNTQQMGSGLVMLGGSNSFGAGNWADTALEKAMPLDFHVKGLKVVPVGAIVLVVDRSGSMTGEKLEMSKAAALAAAAQLGDRDFLGVVSFDVAAEWAVPMARASDRERIARQIARLGAGGGTNMYPGMELAFAALRVTEASVKHMILLTDGQTEGTGYPQLAAAIRRAGITISTVAVGDDSARDLLASVAGAGGGKFYYARSAGALPRIFMNETRRVARPLVYEDARGFSPRVTFAHEMLRGVGDTLPPITGLVMTTPKDSPLVEVSLVSPKPDAQTPLLASWTYGLGKVVALTTDAGNRWAHAWTRWQDYDRLFGQIVRWSLRPTDDENRFVVTTQSHDGKTRVVATALDEDASSADRLELVGSLVRPDMTSEPVVLHKTAPGRYIGEFASEAPGNYLVAIATGFQLAPLRFAVSVGFSPEFKDRTTNAAFLRALAATAPKGGTAGNVLAMADADAPHATDGSASVFRSGLSLGANSRDAWQLLAFLASCMFFADVLVRRVQLSPTWLAARFRRARRPEQEKLDTRETASRLRSRKQQVADQLNRRQAASRFAPPDDSQLPAPALSAPNASHLADSPTSTVPDASKEGEHNEYIARLLKAKLGARQSRRGASLADRREE
jgi:Mg-chelatase subunit ChlD